MDGLQNSITLYNQYNAYEVVTSTQSRLAARLADVAINAKHWHANAMSCVFASELSLVHNILAYDALRPEVHI